MPAEKTGKAPVERVTVADSASSGWPMLLLKGGEEVVLKFSLLALFLKVLSKKKMQVSVFLFFLAENKVRFLQNYVLSASQTIIVP